MPAYTVSQLESQLDSYMEPNGNFSLALTQVLQRVYSLGLWRDLTYEVSLPADQPYISLPADSESVLACTINDLPRPVRSMWHDVRIVGRQPELSPYFGIVDDGYHPVMLDMLEVQDLDDEEDIVPVTHLIAYYSGTTSQVLQADLDRCLTIAALNEDSVRETLDLVTIDTDKAGYESPTGDILKIENIIYSDVPFGIDLVAADFTDKVIASIPAGSGVLRFRRFRVSDCGDDSVVHLLLKRACPAFMTPDTIIHLGNLSAIKHALLARIAEDNADVNRAEYHWLEVTKILDAELDAHRGAAKPALQLNIWGGTSKPYNLF